MSNYLQNLADRIHHAAPVVQPRPVSLFEQSNLTKGQQPWLTVEETDARVSRPFPHHQPSPESPTPSQPNEPASTPASEKKPKPRRERPSPIPSPPAPASFANRITELKQLLELALSASHQERAAAESVVPLPQPTLPAIMPSVEIHEHTIQEKTIVPEKQKWLNGTAVSPTIGPPPTHRSIPPVEQEIKNRRRKQPVPETTSPPVPQENHPIPPHPGAKTSSKKADDKKQVLPAKRPTPPRTVVPVIRPFTLPKQTSPPIENPEPTIHVSIGRIEVRAAPIQSSQPSPRSQPQPVIMSLNDYLRRRAEERSP